MEYKGSLSPIKKIFKILTILLVYSSVIYFFAFDTADPDLWGHIRFGEEIWVTKSIPQVDQYSYTAYGREWINHEWLSEVLMYGVYHILGPKGLLIVKIIIGLAIVFVLMRMIHNQRCDPLIFAIVFVISVSVISPGFMTRPQILTYFFTAFYLFVFHLYLEGKKNLLWSLPLIMIIWVNSHGGFLVGIGIFSIIVISEIFLGFVKKHDPRHLRDLITWLFITGFSTLINPFGIRLIAFLYESLSVSRNITEWGPVSIFDFSYFRLKSLSVLFVLSIFAKKGGYRYREIVIIAIAMIYGFLHQRHTPIFAILAAPFLAVKLSDIWKRLGLKRRLNSFSSHLVLCIVISLIIGYQLSYTSNRYIKTGFNIIVDPNIYPVRAIRFIKANHVRGNMLLPFEWGEYAIWKLYPDCRVSIDGRFRTVYPQEVLDDQFMAFKSEKAWDRLLDKYPSDIILARRNYISRRMVTERKDWICIYSDNMSFVFFKDVIGQKKVVNAFREKSLIYPKSPVSIFFP